MTTLELSKLVEQLRVVRENARLPAYLETELAQAIRKIGEFVTQLEHGELKIVKPQRTF